MPLPVDDVLEHVGVVDHAVAGVKVESDEAGAPRDDGQDGVAEALGDRLEHAALDEALLRVHEELVNAHAVLEVSAQPKTDVARAPEAERTLARASSHHAQVLAATVVRAARVRRVQLHQRVHSANRPRLLKNRTGQRFV
jgi:hypothetical protein